MSLLRWLSLVLWLMALTSIVVMHFSILKRKKQTRINVADNNYIKTERDYSNWLSENPHVDNSDPEAQRLIKKKINAYGARLREAPIEGGELHLRNLINQLEASKTKTDK